MLALAELLTYKHKCSDRLANLCSGSNWGLTAVSSLA